MKIFNKSVAAVLLMTAALTGCGNSEGIPAEIPESSSKAEMSATQETETEIQAEQSSEAENTTVEETTEAPTSAETTAVATTVPIEDRKEKVNQITRTYIEEGLEIEDHYYFVPQEATDISDDINLGLITVDGKEFDITELSNAYGEEEIQNIFGEQAGLYTTDRLIADGVFDDVYTAKIGSPFLREFIFGENRGVEDIKVNQEAYSLPNYKGKYDFITVEYVNDWFRGLHSESVARNNPSSTVEQITIIDSEGNQEKKPFVDEVKGEPKPQFIANNDGLITYTDKNIAVGRGTTYSDLVSMFGAEPTYVDYCYKVGNIYTYRNSTVTVGFVTDYNTKVEATVEEDRNNSSVVAIYMWLND